MKLTKGTLRVRPQPSQISKLISVLTKQKSRPNELSEYDAMKRCINEASVYEKKY